MSDFVLIYALQNLGAIFQGQGHLKVAWLMSQDPAEVYPDQ